MVDDQGIQKTSGTILGDILRYSEITLHRGKYILSIDLATQLQDNGAKLSKPRDYGGISEISSSISYGGNDNILTRVQSFAYPNHRYVNGYEFVKYCYNQWKEIMGGLTFANISNTWRQKNSIEVEGPLEIVLENPREGVERLKGLFKLFIELDKSYQEDFLGEVDTYSCTLYGEMNSAETFKRWKNHPMRSLLIHKIMRGLPKEDRRKLQYVLDLLSVHDVCVAKGEIVRGEIEDLMGYDTTTIPTHWREGTLDDAIIQERVAELNEMLQKSN